MCKQPLIILTGPTAVGKTSLSIKLAKKDWGTDNKFRLYAGIQEYGHRNC